MPASTPDVTITFEGLLMFCTGLQATSKKYCEIGIHSEAPGHEFKITVYDEPSTNPQREPIKLDPQYMCSNPLTIDRESLKQSKGLLMYVGNKDTIPKPKDDSVTFDPTFYRYLLDLQGDDFYKKSVVDRHRSFYKPSLFVADALFYCDSLTQDGQFCIVKEPELNVLTNPKASACDKDQALKDGMVKELDSFARNVKAGIYLDKDNSLVVRDAKGWYVNLPYPQNGKPYYIEIGNLDFKQFQVDPTINCPAFVHHSRAIEHENKPNYGLYPTPGRNFDHAPKAIATDGACCLPGGCGGTPNLPPDPWG